jgi:hypothetical protein
LYLSEFLIRKLIKIQKCIKPPTKTTTFITIKECNHNLMSQKPGRVVIKILKIITDVYVEIPKHSFVLNCFSQENSKF